MWNRNNNTGPGEGLSTLLSYYNKINTAPKLYLSIWMQLSFIILCMSYSKIHSLFLIFCFSKRDTYEINVRKINYFTYSQFYLYSIPLSNVFVFVELISI
ncbi:hypothetical protein SAMN02787081_02478 [Lysinibacillus fusiformis]|uniref:Uncharacterized protein n=1 Tax=Lysinibacillus fusiformis TaxID=28031 RepID=A0A1H9JJZ7_9BACI|nr:hypothetical protein SAMN02787081_02478 [Lysinibacillus fusiformis]SEN75024.1 hypothetical protein SAMN02787103_02529 [Lysinibacillus fusiformis]SEQ87093.1 hypothetical protein SAMN02787113_02542 [Lysinibacillus fusiformis]